MLPTCQIRQTGLTVDLVGHIHCGRTADVTEAVYDANPGLAALGVSRTSSALATGKSRL